MFLFIIFFLCGDFCFQKFEKLPSVTCMSGLLILTLILCLLLKYRQLKFLLLAFAAGFIYSYIYSVLLMTWHLPRDVEGKNIIIEGWIASLPVVNSSQTTFLFAMDKSLIRLSWRKPIKKIMVGDKWQLKARLKRIHSLQNLGGFDYEAWALQKNIRATGYVLNDKDNVITEHVWYRYPIQHLRQKLQNKIFTYLPTSPTAGWLPALIIGERNGMAPEQWQVLRNTGTNHLMAIAGLHIGIIAGFIHFFVSWLWKRIPKLVLIFPASLAGACASLFIAIIYSALAGFSIPTQRACIMLLLFIGFLLQRVKITNWMIWSLAMFLVLVINPLSILTESFWLSFGTIGLIIYGMSGRLAPGGLWWKWGRIQWIIGIGLIPITLIFFQQCSIISFVANSIAIPWLGFFVLPFCFLSSLFLLIMPTIGSGLLHFADQSLAVLWTVLTFFSHLHFATWQQAMPNLSVMLFTLGGFLLLLSPTSMPGKWLSLIWLLPIFCFKYPAPKVGEYWLTLLDVGQGLSVVVQTHQHVLIFDTGPKLSPAYDMGESVLLPFLHSMGIKKIDMLVVSHGDNDHIGGSQALLKSLPVTLIKTSVPDRFSVPANFCRMNESWQWDKVNFIFLHPAPEDLRLGNNSSCVLRIDNNYQSVLLTGDIEKLAEKKLLIRYAKLLKANILIAPHHGSKTSAIKAFVTAVHPDYVLYATGYRNKYHFPHPSVKETYAQIKSMQFNTAESGSIHFKIPDHAQKPCPDLYRVSHRHYWFD